MSADTNNIPVIKGVTPPQPETLAPVKKFFMPLGYLNFPASLGASLGTRATLGLDASLDATVGLDASLDAAPPPVASVSTPPPA
jgi:hypothetical protein